MECYSTVTDKFIYDFIMYVCVTSHATYDHG